MGLPHLLFHAPLLFLLLVVPLLYSVIAHEVSHGWCAKYFGDDTAQRAGRLTLHPLPHLDLVGTLMLFLVGFGWAKPVPVDYGRLRPLRPGIFCVALAGCATNLSIATLALALLQAQLVGLGSAPALMLAVVARINIILGAFNLIPVPPLDGSRIVLSLLPSGGQRALLRLERYGFIILIVLLATGWLNPVIRAMEGLLLGLIAAMFGLAR